MNTIELTCKVIELFLEFIGLLLIVVGWIVPYRQSLKTQINNKIYEMNFQKRKWYKELVDKQISEFYGPISELLHEDTMIFRFVLEQMGRKSVFEDGHHKMSDLSFDDQKRWKHYVEYYKIPFQNKILDIIRKNKHLVYESKYQNVLMRLLNMH